jgi:hypothetical protein
MQMKNQEAQSLEELGLSANEFAAKQAKVDVILHPAGSAIGTLAETGIAPPVARKPRADKGKPRAVKAAEPEPVAGMLTREQVEHLEVLRVEMDQAEKEAVQTARLAKIAEQDYRDYLDELTAKA